MTDEEMQEFLEYGEMTGDDQCSHWHHDAVELIRRLRRERDAALDALAEEDPDAHQHRVEDDLAGHPNKLSYEDWMRGEYISLAEYNEKRER